MTDQTTSFMSTVRVKFSYLVNSYRQSYRLCKSRIELNMWVREILDLHNTQQVSVGTGWYDYFLHIGTQDSYEQGMFQAINLCNHHISNQLALKLAIELDAEGELDEAMRVSMLKASDRLLDSVTTSRAGYSNILSSELKLRDTGLQTVERDALNRDLDILAEKATEALHYTYKNTPKLLR